MLLAGTLGGPRALAQAADSEKKPAPFAQPQPLQPGAKVVTLWPAGSPALKSLTGYDKPEDFRRSRSAGARVEAVTNIHNPSVELHLAPPDKANGMAIIVAAGGGNTTLNVGGEGLDIAKWLNSLGISAFIERYRLRPYGSATDALADTQRSFRLIRANAHEWNIDPKRVGIMGFSAGGEQAARVALNFDAGNPSADDAVDRQSDRPDFVVLVYAGWSKMDLSKVPKNAPPAFLTCAGIDDAFHARETVEFYNAWFNAKIPVELHIYGHGGHAGGIRPRNGIPFGTWQLRFVDWITDLGMMKPQGVPLPGRS
ncbi:MAG TPA: alpha/beta hydrolase [Tepidisphaeraceae bacterium]|nr:alpha/beta hydrolase [Tepidisphaeraceae bacterium]